MSVPENRYYIQGLFRAIFNNNSNFFTTYDDGVYYVNDTNLSIQESVVDGTTVYMPLWAKPVHNYPHEPDYVDLVELWEKPESNFFEAVRELLFKYMNEYFDGYTEGWLYEYHYTPY